MAKKIEKVRNNNTLSEQAFWGWVRSLLRRGSMRWKPLQEIKKLSRRPYIGENKRRKWEYQCNYCKNWFIDNDIEIDHIYGTGGLTRKEDLGTFVENLFCEIDKLQVLCVKCHLEKTNNEKKIKKESNTND